MIYTSKQNDTIKFLASLKDKKNRVENGLYVAEGLKMVNEAIKLKKDIYAVVAVSNVCNRITKGEYKLIEVTKEVFSVLSDEKTPQGCLVVLRIPKVSSTPCDKVLILDRVSDPGNMGTIIRTAAAFGYNDLYLIESTDPFSPKAVRSSMSGIYAVNIHQVPVKQIFDELSSHQLICADMDGENLNGFKHKDKFAIILGNEANGVEDCIRCLADKVVSIPMNECVESLNVGVAGSILMYKLMEE